ncbi:nucleoid-associated protein [Isobaculum melis]|uniref:Nucleoid-associated protein n=1 Tax=Isobaculum melis TaxID=142588 RepID=A0A1H9Q0S9_9LACT|nr:nucleoid-associated protein [Isobaculum melis]SER54061.1 hypothetical protein SAMN04488559_101279 [Isobaculum melis]
MIEFKKMIAHKLNVKNALPILSGSCIDLEHEDIQLALPFFEKHINNSRNQSSIKRCQFEAIEDNVVRKSMSLLVDAIENDEYEDIFIQESKNLALNLSKRIKDSTSTSDGTLFVLSYRNGENDLIGLLKMDPNDGVQINDDLTITVHKQMLPSINEKLHKSALIYLKEYKKNEEHLLVLDKQQGVNEPAKFFIENFLNAKELSSDKKMTLYVQSKLSSEFDQIIDNIIEFDVQVKNKLATCKKFNIDSDLETLLRQNLRPEFETLDLSPSIEEFKVSLLKEQPDAVFEFTPELDYVNENVFRTPDKKVEFRFAPTLELEKDFTIQEVNEEVIITIKNGRGHGLEPIKSRRR